MNLFWASWSLGAARLMARVANMAGLRFGDHWGGAPKKANKERGREVSFSRCVPNSQAHFYKQKGKKNTHTLMVYNATIHTSHPNKYRVAACFTLNNENFVWKNSSREHVRDIFLQIGRLYNTKIPAGHLNRFVVIPFSLTPTSHASFLTFPLFCAKAPSARETREITIV